MQRPGQAAPPPEVDVQEIRPFSIAGLSSAETFENSGSADESSATSRAASGVLADLPQGLGRGGVLRLDHEAYGRPGLGLQADRGPEHAAGERGDRSAAESRGKSGCISSTARRSSPVGRKTSLTAASPGAASAAGQLRTGGGFGPGAAPGRPGARRTRCHGPSRRSARRGSTSPLVHRTGACRSPSDRPPAQRHDGRRWAGKVGRPRDQE